LLPKNRNKTLILIAAKVEIRPTGVTLGIKAEIVNIFSISPKLLMNAKLYWPQSLRKAYHQIWEANLQPLGPMFPAFIGLAY
jgi:hypothetical protein